MTEQEIRKYLRRIEEENSQTALRSFYNLCFDRFFRIAYYYLHTEEWAQEVVLDVFLKIWERRESLHHIANLEDYFFVTIKNASLNYLEKEQRRKDMTADAFDGVSISGESPEDILGISVNTVDVQLQKAIGRMRDMLSRYISGTEN